MTRFSWIWLEVIGVEVAIIAHLFLWPGGMRETLIVVVIVKPVVIFEIIVIAVIVDFVIVRVSF